MGGRAESRINFLMYQRWMSADFCCLSYIQAKVTKRLAGKICPALSNLSSPSPSVSSSVMSSPAILAFTCLLLHGSLVSYGLLGGKRNKQFVNEYRQTEVLSTTKEHDQYKPSGVRAAFKIVGLYTAKVT